MNLDNVIDYLLPIGISIGVKVALYLSIFKFRRYVVPWMTIFIMSAASLIPTAVINLPLLLGWLIGIGISIFLLSQNSEVPIVFEGVLIIFGVEILAPVIERLLISPLFFS